MNSSIHMPMIETTMVVMGVVRLITDDTTVC